MRYCAAVMDMRTFYVYVFFILQKEQCSMHAGAGQPL